MPTTKVPQAVITPPSGGYSFRNKIINGAFRINQRGYVSGGATVLNQFTFDRWKATNAGGFTFSTVNGKTTLTLANFSAGIEQSVPAEDLPTGTYVLSWEGTAEGRIGGGSWGTSGNVVADITGGTGVSVFFRNGTVTNVQLEMGTVATPFAERPYGIEFALCQRFYFRTPTDVPVAAGYFESSTEARGFMHFPVRMFGTPALETSGTSSDYSINRTGGSVSCTSVPTVVGLTKGHGATLSFTRSGGSFTTGQACVLFCSSSGYIAFNSDY